MNSVFCEHTAEFVLIPRIKRVLADCYEKVVPIYYWKTREGSLLSKEIHKYYKVRTLAVFPRRAKIKRLQPTTIFGKINKELIEFAKLSRSRGIPAIAGWPIVSTIDELDDSKQPVYLNLSEQYNEEFIFEIDISTLDFVSVDPASVLVEFISEEEIPNIIGSSGYQMDWENALEVINELRMSVRHNFFYMPFGGYKPVYMLIFNQKYKK